MKYFGTDGIRGKEVIFTVEFLERIADAIVAEYGIITVVTARDTRSSGERIAGTLGAKLAGYGCRVIDVGMTATPVLAYLTRACGARIGIMISASHNPPEYNGIKLFGMGGAKITTEEEERLERRIDEAHPAGVALGKITKFEGDREYLTHFAALVAPAIKGKKVLLDCANGASSSIAPELYSMLGAEVTAINTERDGKRINENSGATHPEVLLGAMEDGIYDIGFTYDGDADRVLCVKDGKLYDGDDMMYIAARYYAEKGELHPAKIVGTIMSNMGTESSLSKHGIALERTPVGDKYVSEAMSADDIKIGGEASGHIIFRDYQNTGDGILTSLLIAKIDAERGLRELYDLVKYPSASADIVTDAEGIKRFGGDEIKEYLAVERAALSGRIIARASGTEPKIRLMVEAEQYESAYAALERIKTFINGIVNSKQAKSVTPIRYCGYLNEEKRKDICMKHSANGVCIVDPATTYISEDAEIGTGSVIYPMCTIAGRCKIGNNVKIYSFTDITDTVVGDNSDLRSTYALGAGIGAGTTVGPFACLRKGAVIGDGCRVGDFVEVKNSTLGAGVKAAHLAYVGDAEVGENTNVGCGTVFANYNGKIKQRVKVGKGVFIGCNANLIAPVEVGDGAYIAGGSTVTEDIPEGSLCIARARQVIKSNWRKP